MYLSFSNRQFYRCDISVLKGRKLHILIVFVLIFLHVLKAVGEEMRQMDVFVAQ